MIPWSVSCTCTTLFNQLKVFLITWSSNLDSVSAIGNTGSAKAIENAVAYIYLEGGILAFWTDNGLSVMKIFSDSAIKFFSYESVVSIMHLAS